MHKCTYVSVSVYISTLCVYLCVLFSVCYIICAYVCVQTCECLLPNMYRYVCVVCVYGLYVVYVFVCVCVCMLACVCVQRSRSTRQMTTGTITPSPLCRPVWSRSTPVWDLTSRSSTLSWWRYRHCLLVWWLVNVLATF